jgi:hypothetical protein
MTQHESHERHHPPKISPEAEKKARANREQHFHAEAAAWARQHRLTPEQAQAFATAAGMKAGPVTKELAEQFTRTRDKALNAAPPPPRQSENE